MKFERQTPAGTLEIETHYEWKREHKEPVICFNVHTPRNENGGYRTCFVYNGINYALSYAAWHTGLTHPNPTYLTLQRVNLVAGTGYVHTWNDPEPTSKALTFVYDVIRGLWPTLVKDEALIAQLRAETREHTLSTKQAAHEAAIKSVTTTLEDLEAFKANPDAFMPKRDN